MCVYHGLPCLYIRRLTCPCVYIYACVFPYLLCLCLPLCFLYYISRYIPSCLCLTLLAFLLTPPMQASVTACLPNVPLPTCIDPSLFPRSSLSPPVPCEAPRAEQLLQPSLGSNQILPSICARGQQPGGFCQPFNYLILVCFLEQQKQNRKERNLESTYFASYSESVGCGVLHPCNI